MDAFAGHTTSAVLNKLHAFDIFPFLISGGSTGLLQPLDTAVNKPFKLYLPDLNNRSGGGDIWGRGGHLGAFLN